MIRSSSSLSNKTRALTLFQTRTRGSKSLLNINRLGNEAIQRRFASSCMATQAASRQNQQQKSGYENHGSSRSWWKHQHSSKTSSSSTAAAMMAATGLAATSTAKTVAWCEKQTNARDPNVHFRTSRRSEGSTDSSLEPKLQATSVHSQQPASTNDRGQAQFAKAATLASRGSIPIQQPETQNIQQNGTSNQHQSQSFPQATSPKAITIAAAAKADAAHPMSIEEVRMEEARRKAKQHSGGLKLFSGNGNMALAMEIASSLGVNLGKATVGRFADGEVNVRIHENVRGKDCYVIQPTCPPVNDNLMELLLMVSTLSRASARRITVVIPYYGYARQDRKMQARVPISAADVARLLEAMGVDRVIAVDLHCGQIQGFFGPRVPVDNLDGIVVGLDYFGAKDLHNPVVVSPDAGGVYRAKKFKEGLAYKYEMDDIGLAMIIKQRARAGSVDQMDLVGDVKDCDCILVDDMIDTAGTICKASDVLKENGARRVFGFASHGLLSGPGNERVARSSMEEVVILNTIPTSPQRAANDKLTELSVAPLLAQAIYNIHTKRSISALFK